MFHSAKYLSLIDSVIAATSEDQMADRLQTASSYLQQALLEEDALADLLACQEDMSPSQESADIEVIRRAVSLHVDDSGNTLALLSVPVYIRSSQKLPLQLPLLRTKARPVRIAASVQTQHCLPEAGGWAKVYPVLWHENLAKDVSLDQLIRFPHEVRRTIHEPNRPIPSAPASEGAPDGTNHVYHLPVVAYFPKGAKIALTHESDELAFRLTKLVEDSLMALGVTSDQFKVVSSGLSEPFAQAMVNGERLARRLQASHMLRMLCADRDVQPAALVAKVCSGVLAGNSMSELFVGATFASALTGHVVGQLVIPQEDIEDTTDYCAIELGGLLRSMGLRDVQIVQGPVTAASCINCGVLHLPLPAVIPAAVSASVH